MIILFVFVVLFALILIFVRIVLGKLDMTTTTLFSKSMENYGLVMNVM